MILREMFLLSLLLVLSRAWEILPVEVDENERRDRESNDPIQTIQNKEAMSYNIHGVDSEQFEIETINDGSCGNNYKTCGKLWLKSGVTLDREEKEVYQITGESLGTMGMKSMTNYVSMVIIKYILRSSNAIRQLFDVDRIRRLPSVPATIWT